MSSRDGSTVRRLDGLGTATGSGWLDGHGGLDVTTSLGHLGKGRDRTKGLSGSGEVVRFGSFGPRPPPFPGSIG